MPIKYPSKYQPKYYNPNWSQYQHEKISWDYHKKKQNEYAKYASTLKSIPINAAADEIGKFPKYK